MFRAQVDGEAVGFTDLSQPAAEIDMMFVQILLAMVFVQSHAQPAASVFLLQDAFGVVMAFLSLRGFWEFDRSITTQFPRSPFL
jgi:hypothetical protein